MNDNDNQSKNQKTDSLLDEVLREQQAERKGQIQPQELIAGLFAVLSKQEVEILKRRYALYEAEEIKKQTLEAIGKFYKVTRERIRQIESRAIKKIKQDGKFKDLVSPFEAVVFDTLEFHGGIMQEDFLVNKLLEISEDESVSNFGKQALLFIISKLLDKNLEKVRADEYFMPGWKLKIADVELFRKILDELHSFIENQGKPTLAENLVAGFKDYSHDKDYEATDKIILSALEASAKTKRNSFGEWGLIDWRTIVPKRMSDKIYLVLEKTGKPLHFNEIAEAINKQGFDSKTANPATVHNELIMGDKYILVGRGVYALKNWGYIPGIVPDVIVGIIKKKGPLAREEIIDEVLKQRMVKPGTVLLALSDKSKFKRLDDGRYNVVDLE